MKINDTYIASNVISFEDFINSPISRGKSIHCTFYHEELEIDFYIKKKLAMMDIENVSFLNGFYLTAPDYHLNSR